MLIANLTVRSAVRACPLQLRNIVCTAPSTFKLEPMTGKVSFWSLGFCFRRLGFPYGNPHRTREVTRTNPYRTLHVNAIISNPTGTLADTETLNP